MLLLSGRVVVHLTKPSFQFSIFFLVTFLYNPLLAYYEYYEGQPNVFKDSEDTNTEFVANPNKRKGYETSCMVYRYTFEFSGPS